MSEQYLAAHDAGADGVDDDEAEALPSGARKAHAPRSRFLSGFLFKRRASEGEKAPVTTKPASKNSKEVKGLKKRKGNQDEQAPETPANVKYTPHLYAERRVHFIHQARADGMSLKEAQEAWHESDVKAAMLSTLSLPELKRRRFVPKGVTSNPFVARAGG